LVNTFPTIFGSKLFSRSRIHELKILLRFLDIILRVLRLEVSVYNFFTLQTSFTPLFSMEEWELNPLVKVTVNSKEEKLLILFPNYVQEFVLRNSFSPP
jgi:hypothetical protein